MSAQHLADLVVLTHFLFILFVVLGGLPVLRWPRLAWLHVPAVVWGALIEFTGGICPLTPLENSLREAAGDTGYQGGFIGHYLLPVIYPETLTREIQWLLGALVLLINAAVYVQLIRRHRHKKGRRGSTVMPGL